MLLIRPYATACDARWITLPLLAFCLRQVLEAQGHNIVSPADRRGLHPLLIPLAQQHQQRISATSTLTCLLRWPEGHKGMELPVVQQERGGTQVRAREPAARDARCSVGTEGWSCNKLGLVFLFHAFQVRLLARSLDEYLHRALAEEESNDDDSNAVADAAGGDGAALYEAGAVSRSGLPSLDAYLTRKVSGPWREGGATSIFRLQRCVCGMHRLKVMLRPAPSLQAGMYPDVAERLALAHLAKEDTMSALITGGWRLRAVRDEAHEFNRLVSDALLSHPARPPCPPALA